MHLRAFFTDREVHLQALIDIQLQRKTGTD